MLEKRSVCADALARTGGLDRNEGELDSMSVDDLRWALARVFSRSGHKYVRRSCVTQRWPVARRVRGTNQRSAHAAPRRRNPGNRPLLGGFSVFPAMLEIQPM